MSSGEILSGRGEWLCVVVFNLSAEYLRICSPAVDYTIRSGGGKTVSGSIFSFYHA